jgi:hypothetical protein
LRKCENKEENGKENDEEMSKNGFLTTFTGE